MFDLLTQLLLSLAKPYVVAQCMTTHYCLLLGIKDLSSVSKDHSLGKLGLDSLTTAEVKQVLENQYNLSYTVKEIRNLTLASLKATEATMTD